MRTIEARRRVGRPREELYAELSDLRGHWDLAGRWVQPLELRNDGGTVRVRGPLGLQRTIRTRLTDARPPDCVAGEALAGATLAAIRWDLEEAPGGGTDVTLVAEIVRCGRLDRVLLELGGRRWMEGRFRATIHRLG